MTPLDNRVLVRRKITEEKTSGGIILPVIRSTALVYNKHTGGGHDTQAR